MGALEGSGLCQGPVDKMKGELSPELNYFRSCVGRGTADSSVEERKTPKVCPGLSGSFAALEADKEQETRVEGPDLAQPQGCLIWCWSSLTLQLRVLLEREM